MSDEQGNRKRGPGRPRVAERQIQKSITLRRQDFEYLASLAHEAYLAAVVSTPDDAPRPKASLSLAVRWLLEQERKRRTQGGYRTYHVVGAGPNALLLEWELPSYRRVSQAWDMRTPLMPPPIPADYDPATAELDAAIYEANFLDAAEQERRQLEAGAAPPPAWHEVKTPRAKAKRKLKPPTKRR